MILGLKCGISYGGWEGRWERFIGVGEGCRGWEVQERGDCQGELGEQRVWVWRHVRVFADALLLEIDLRSSCIVV